MTPTDWTMATGIAVTALIVLFLIIQPKKPKWMKVDLEKRRLTKKENALLTDLVTDMREHPGHWVKNGHCPITFKGPIIVNDYSCVGLQFSERAEEPETVVILFNTENNIKFEQADPNTIATRIQGPHAKKFINTVTKIMDERGKEIDYFRSRIQERL